MRRALAGVLVPLGLLMAAVFPTAAMAASWTSVPAPWMVRGGITGFPLDITRQPNSDTVWTSGGFGGGLLPFNENTGAGWVTNPFPGSPISADPTASFYGSITAVTSGRMFSVGAYRVDLGAFHPAAAMWDGVRWTPLHADERGTDTYLWDVGASSPTTIWAVGTMFTPIVEPLPFTVKPVIEKYEPGHGFLLKRILPVCTGCVETLGGISRIPKTQDMWAVGYFAPSISVAKYIPIVERYAGGTWGTPQRFNALATDGTTIVSVAAASRNDAWAVGGRQMLRWNGQSWRIVTPPPNVGSLDRVRRIPGTRQYWAVGMQPDGSSLALRWNGWTWKTLATPNVGELTGVAAISSTNAWAVGYAGSIHYH